MEIGWVTKYFYDTFLTGDLLTLMPCILDMALKGLKALNVRIVLNAWIPPAPSKDAVKLIRDTYFRIRESLCVVSDY